MFVLWQEDGWGNDGKVPGEDTEDTAEAKAEERFARRFSKGVEAALDQRSRLQAEPSFNQSQMGMRHRALDWDAATA